MTIQYKAVISNQVGILRQIGLFFMKSRCKVWLYLIKMSRIYLCPLLVDMKEFSVNMHLNDPFKPSEQRLKAQNEGIH